ncbi:nuclear pore complex protein Nup58 isoform X2 [Pectinophora gossypiella]|uniref:nuclear pore complex protein Nup58 isoform X2 n=1 Tax=Pectinophora gossypiella TaxID=13191 RepID=UPI00214E8DCD|nr:nuclear pore complex protein Nup58 isoform X2 [Pectinophora gossypiella]
MSFSFGTPSSAPASTGLTGGFSFGANKPATPGFGLTATSQPSTGLFGSTPATSAPAFGTTTPAFGATAGFGAGSTPGFGASATPAFGATSTAPAFGTGTTPAFGATSTAPAFGATAAPAFGSTPGFGATSTAPTFGATSTPAFGAISAAPAFGSTTTPAFGANTTPGFGAGLGTGGLNFGIGTNTSTAPTGLTLGAPATTASVGLGGLGGFGFGTTTTQNTGLGGGLFNISTTTSAGLFGPKLGTTTVTAAPSLGLGGVQPSGTANTTTSGDGKTEPPKQAKLPNEIVTTVDSFKDFVKKQKSLSSEIMRVSVKPLHKVAREAEATLRLALSLGGDVGRARAHSRRLRAAAAAALATAESLANCPATELEGTAPPSYVKELISELEQQLIAFRRQMDVADKQMQASPKLLTEQELTMGIRRMHESLVALAGRLQAVHTQVEEQKEQYLNLRKYVLKDPTNVFDTPDTSTSLDQILRDAEGSRKKTKPSHLSGSNLTSAVLSDPRAALGSIQQLAGPTPFTYIGSAISQFPNTDTSGASWQPQCQPNVNTSLNVSFGATTSADSSTFQLQKPPGKRGKQ